MSALTLEHLADVITPEQTVLFMGAGASVASGGPIGPGLARTLAAKLAGGQEISDDLVEASSILENRYGRAALVGAVRDELNGLEPTGGLLAIPSYPWRAIYTTNFDELIEKAYRRAGKPCVVTQSNFDYARNEARDGTPLYKIHGSLGRDWSNGDKFGMVRTEVDYERAQEYRETLFRSLALDLLTKDIVIVGYSLKDAKLREQMIDAAEIHQK